MLAAIRSISAGSIIYSPVFDEPQAGFEAIAVEMGGCITPEEYMDSRRGPSIQNSGAPQPGNFFFSRVNRDRIRQKLVFANARDLARFAHEWVESEEN